MIKVLKYFIGAGRGEIAIAMPREAKILTAKFQGANIQVWAEVAEGDENELEVKKFKVVYTGESFTAAGRKYISTLFDNGLVYHIYEI